MEKTNTLLNVIETSLDLKTVAKIGISNDITAWIWIKFMHSLPRMCKMEGMENKKIAFNKVVLEDFCIFAI